MQDVETCYPVMSRDAQRALARSTGKITTTLEALRRATEPSHQRITMMSESLRRAMEPYEQQRRALEKLAQRYADSMKPFEQSARQFKQIAAQSQVSEVAQITGPIRELDRQVKAFASFTGQIRGFHYQASEVDRLVEGFRRSAAEVDVSCLVQEGPAPAISSRRVETAAIQTAENTGELVAFWRRTENRPPLPDRATSIAAIGSIAALAYLITGETVYAAIAAGVTVLAVAPWSYFLWQLRRFRRR